MPVSEPSKILTPFATSGLKNTIPQAANNVTGNAGYDQGFPAINMTAKEAGGIPPFGQDFNGIFNDLTKAIQFIQAGGIPTYNSAFATAVGGYAKGAVIIGADGETLYQNLTAGNTTNPNTGGANWQATVANQYPVGAPIPWSLAAPPSGFLIMTGQSFSAITYPKLAVAYPGLVLPDMRAEFIRGWDNARGVDTGRAILSAQTDAIRNITGAIGFTDDDSSNAPKVLASGAFTIRSGTLKPSMTGTVGTPSTTEYLADFNASAVVPTAPENRPRNIAFNYIVRAA